MDPITTAIVAALPALATTALKTSIGDAYDALKAVIKRKWGDDSKVAKSVDALEATPENPVRAQALTENLHQVNATGDQDVMRALATLVDALKEHGVGGATVRNMSINVSGGGTVSSAIVANTVTTGPMTFGDARDPKS